MGQENQVVNQSSVSKQKGIHKKSKISPIASKPSLSRVALGVTAASGASLLAVSWLGLGPVMVASAAGYLTYHGMTSKRS